MAGATNRHNELITRLAARLLPLADARGCEVFTETVKLFRYRSERYLYPDLMVTCNPLDLQTRNGVRSPLLILEVLSKSNTYGHMKFKQREYFRLPSLRHYLLMEQNEMAIQHFYRQEGDLWRIRFYDEPDQQIELPEWSVSLRLGDLYAGITFEPEISEAEEAAAWYGVGEEES